jgi:tetratricopeptide (TPR) repeat protein
METKFPSNPKNTYKTPEQLFEEAKETFRRKDHYGTLKILNLIKNKTREHLLMQASCLNSLHKSKQAIAILNTIKQDDEAIRRIAICNETLGNYTQAINLLEQLYKKNKREADLIALADCLLLRQEEEDKEKAFKILSSLKENIKAQIHLAHLYQKLNLNEEAFNVYVYIKQQWPNYPQGYFALGRWYENEKQYENAIETYKLINEIKEPIDPIHLEKKEMNLGFSYEYLGHYDEALKHFAAVKSIKGKLAMGRCYEHKKEYERAINEIYLPLHTMKKKNPLVILKLGECYHQIGDYKSAIQFFELAKTLPLSNEQRTKMQLDLKSSYQAQATINNEESELEPVENSAVSTRELDFLNILLKNAEYDNAIELIQKLLQQSQDLDLLILLADCYRRKGNHKSAFELYSNLPNFDQISWDKKMDIIHYYQKLGYFDKVIHCAFIILKMNSEHVAIKYILGHAYEKLDLYNKALEVYSKITPSFKRDLIIAGCYREMGNFIESEKIYRSYWENAVRTNNTYRLKELYLAFAVYYEKMDNYCQAISVYKKAYSHFHLSYSEQLHIMKSLALYSAKIGNKNEMLGWIESASKFSVSEQKKQKIKRWQVHCYDSIGSYQEVIDTVLALKEFSNPPYEKLSLALSYEQLKNPLEQVEAVYQEIITNFPNFCTAYYYYCNYLIKYDPTKALPMIQNFEHKWSNNPKLYLLKFHYAVTKNIAFPDSILKEAISQFPYFTSAFLDLIDYYTLNNRLTEAVELKILGWKRFPGHPKFKNFAPTFELSPDIKNAFNSLKDIKGISYLTGTAVHQLIDPFAYSDQTIELVVLLEQGAGFFPKEYLPLPYNSKVYQRKEQNYLINCYISPEPNLEEDARKRAFTIFTLYCSERGTLIDPTGLGLKHVKARILDTVNDPETLFNSSVECILLACRLMAWGYTPSERVHHAMKNFTFKDEAKLEYIKGFVRGDFDTLVFKERYVTALKEYNLLEIFDIDNAEQLLLDDLLTVLKTKLYPDDNQSVSNGEPKMGTLEQKPQSIVTVDNSNPQPTLSEDNAQTQKTNAWPSAKNVQRLFKPERLPTTLNSEQYGTICKKT